MLLTRKNQWGAYVIVSLLQLLFFRMHGSAQCMLKLNNM